MKRAYQSTCCAVLAIAIVLLPSAARAQFGENPFEPTQEDRDANLFGPSEPTPEPISAIDPAPADDIPLPAVADTRAAAFDQSFCRCIDEGATFPSVARILHALRSPLKQSGFDFDGQAFEEIVTLLQKEYNIPIQMDAAALDDQGVAVDQPVTLHVRNISLRSALRLMLRQLGLTYIVEDEVLKITSPDEAEQQLRVCVYDVRDLIDPSNPSDIESLKTTVISCVATETWAANGGGEAEIRPFRQSLLVVSQTQAVHDEVRALLETIRSQLRMRRSDAAAAVPPGIRQSSSSDVSDIVTRRYYLQINQQPGSEPFAPKILELITQAIPDEQWAGRLDNNEPVVLTVLPDRVVLRHRQSVQNKVLSLLSDSGLTVPPADVAGRRGFGGGGGGFGGGESGGGGGFFNPQP